MHMSEAAAKAALQQAVCRVGCEHDIDN